MQDPNKLSPTERQLKHYNEAKKSKTGMRLDLSANAISDTAETGSIFPFLAATSALIAAAAPAVAKSAALDAVGKAAGMALKKDKWTTIKNLKKGTRFKITRNWVGSRSETAGNVSLKLPMSNFDLLDDDWRLNIKNLQRCFHA